jgi:AcrR family transcriptional regulator
MLPLVAAAFAELGYRRATTAQLAERCGVRENVLYRVWPGKKEMFLAAIGYVSELSLSIWQRLLVRKGEGSAAERILAYEAAHHGEFGLYRIVFAGLNETDDPQIRHALCCMYRRFHQFIVEQLKGQQIGGVAIESLAWAMIGVGTVSNIARELGLLSERQRRQVFNDAGRLFIASPQRRTRRAKPRRHCNE